MIYSSWDIEQNILKLVILGHFLPFYPSKNPKNQNFEKWKNLLEIPFYTCTKNHNYMMYGSWDKVRLTDFFVILDHFLPFVPDPENLNFEKIKKTPKILSFCKCVPKWQSYVWFLRYGVQHTEFFLILDHLSC